MLINKKYDHGQSTLKLRSKRFLKATRAQTILEYMSLIAIIATVLVTMSVHMGRGINGMIRLVADQIGNQKDADQRRKKIPGQRDDSGFLINSYTTDRVYKSKISASRTGNFSYRFSDASRSDSTAMSNLGFRER